MSSGRITASMISRVWILLLPAGKAEGADALVEVGALHAESAGSAGNVPTGFLQGAEDVLALGGFAGFLNGGLRAGFALDADLHGDGIAGEAVALREDGHAFDDVAEFARVAGPGVAVEQGKDGFVEHLAAEIIAGAELFQEIFGEQADVVGTLAERGDADGDAVEAVIQILAKLLLRDHAGEVAVGGGDDAHGDANDLLAADAVELAFLQDPQQFGLRSAVKIADFVEEDGAAVSLFEFAAARGGGAGEGTFFMAEELGFEQFGGNGGAIAFDDGGGGEGAGVVDVGGQQLLAGAGFANQQDA